MMDFYINFTLDEEFKEVIKSPVHEDFSYESFSEGEKMRIDPKRYYSLQRDIAKMRNSPSTNLLILDEIFDSSLDDAGTEFFTKIIRYVIQDAHVFVISHKTDGIIDQFDKVMRFDKVKGFSNYYRHLKKCHMTSGRPGVLSYIGFIRKEVHARQQRNQRKPCSSSCNRRSGCGTQERCNCILQC